MTVTQSFKRLVSAQHARRVLLLLLCSAPAILLSSGSGLITIAADDAASVRDSASLVWTNGDRLPGQLRSIGEDHLTWSSPLFRDALAMDRTFIAAVELSDARAPLPAGRLFRIETVRGNVVFGDFAAATDDEFIFSSAAHGLFRMKRESLRSLQRLDPEALVYLGPRGLGEWQAQNAENPVSHWRETPSGRLTTSRRGAGLFLPVPLPMKSEIEFKIRSSGRCSFALGLRNAFRGLRLETWDDSLVAARSLEFQELRTLSNEDRVLQLTLFVDLSGGSLIACSDTGERLAEFRFSDEARTSTGVSFSNRDADITLEYLRISRWDGTPPPDVSDAEDRLQLADGSTVPGTIAAFDAGAQQLQVIREGADPASVSLADVNRVFQYRTSTAAEDSATVVTTNGEVITGRSVRVRDDRLQITTNWSHEPLQVDLSAVREIEWPRNAASAAAADVLTVDDHHLHGTVEIDGTSESPLKWSPVGAQQSVALSGTGQAVFRRGAAEAVPVDLQTFPHVVHLQNGDMIPCRITAADEAGFSVNCLFSETDFLPASAVVAAELAVKELRRSTGMDAESWQRESADVAADGSRVILQPGGVIFNEQMMRGDHTGFDVDWSQNSLCVLGLYVSHPGWRGVQPDLFLVLREGSVSFCRDLESVPLATSAQGRAAPSVRDAVQSWPVSNGGSRARFDVQLQDDRLVVSMDDVPIGEKTVASGRAGWSHFGIRDLGIGVARKARLNDGIVSPNRAAAVTISDFEVTASTSTTARWVHSEETRRLVVTVPRFRRDAPPTHVLIAPNGDLLRGRLRALSDGVITFESRLETIRLPMERVAAVICLASLTDEEPPAGDGGGQLQVQTGSGYALTLVPATADEKWLGGRSPVLGKCRVPVDEIAAIAVGAAIGGPQERGFQEWLPLSAREPDWGSATAEGMTAELEQMLGEPAPSFTLRTLQGTSVSLAESTGRIVVLDFWASWCGPCAEAIPDTLAALASFDAADVTFAAVNIREDASVVRRFLAQKDLMPLTLLDRDGAVAESYGVTGIPHSVIIGPDGRVADILVGYRPDTARLIRDKVTDLLKPTLPSGASSEAPTDESDK